MEKMNIQAYVNQAQGIDKYLLVTKICDTIVCELLLSYTN